MALYKINVLLLCPRKLSRIAVEWNSREQHYSRHTFWIYLPVSPCGCYRPVPVLQNMPWSVRCRAQSPTVAAITATVCLNKQHNDTIALQLGRHTSDRRQSCYIRHWLHAIVSNRVPRANLTKKSTISYDSAIMMIVVVIVIVWT